MRLLLHVCCGPCTIVPLKILRGEGHEVTGSFFNPNIHPYREFDRRRTTLMEYARGEAFPVVWDGLYDLEGFLEKVAFRPDRRCAVCLSWRLDHTARLCRELRLDGFTTTLLYSRHQPHGDIRDMAAAAAREYGISFLYRDFRTGWQEGVMISREKGLYRQPYCGCIYSERDRFLGRPGRKAIPDLVQA